MQSNTDIQRGILLISQSRPDLAEKHLRQALLNSPDDPAGHAWLAEALGAQDRHVDALRCATEAVRLAPDWDFAYAAQARQLLQLGRLKESEAAISQALRLNPLESSYYGLRAAIDTDRGQWEEALGWSEKGLQHDADDSTCANLRSMALVKLGRKEEALSASRGILSRQPEDALSHSVQGWNYLEKSQPRPALEHFREALRLDPQMEHARSGLVEALKARHLVYRLMLRYFLWMGRFPKGAQWAIILGMWLASRLINTGIRLQPQFEWLLLPMGIAVSGFILMTWCAGPLFNLALLLNRHGWYALRKHERIGTLLFGGVLAGGLVMAAGAWLGESIVALGLAALFAGLLMPTAGTFGVADRKMRLRLVACLCGLAIVGVVALWTFLVDWPKWGSLASMFLVGSIGFGWVINFLVLRKKGSQE